MLAPKIMKDKHFKLRLATEGPAGNLDALGWRMADRLLAEPLLPADEVDLAFRLEANHYSDPGGLQLVLSDFIKTSPSRQPAQLAQTAANAQP